MDPNYPMKTLNPNSKKVGVSWSEGLSYTVIRGLQLTCKAKKSLLKQVEVQIDIEKYI